MTAGLAPHRHDPKLGASPSSKCFKNRYFNLFLLRSVGGQPPRTLAMRAPSAAHTHSHIYIFMYMGFPTRPSVDVRPAQALLCPDQRMGRLRPCQERVIQTLTRFTRRWGALAGVPRGGGFTAMEACQRVIRSM